MDLSKETEGDARPVRHQGRATAPSPRTACWPAGWPSGGCGSSSSTTATGTTTANVKGDIPVVAKEVDQGMTALLKDLKRRGLWEDTLVVWGGEFGRTPMAQGDAAATTT